MSARHLILALALGSGCAEAAINRCVALDGVLVYTDRTCASLGIAERGEPSSRPTEPMLRRRPGASRLIGFGCAASSAEGLRRAVVDALDRGDFNALSGLYNFDGRSRHSAAAIVRRLEHMARRTATEVELVVAQSDIWFDVPMVDSATLPTLRVVQQSQESAGSLNIESFNMTRSAGCLWLSN